jgi:hypothetical protein
MTLHSDERERLLQSDWRRNRLDNIGTEPWVTVYAIPDVESGKDVIYSALIPNDQVKYVLNEPAWDLSIGDGMPGCSIYQGPDGEQVDYNRLGRDSGIEPLVIARDFHGLRESYLEILEEFRFFHNLYYDQNNNQYVKITERGDEQVIIRMTADRVEVRLKEIRQFLAIKEMHLAIFFEVVQYSAHELDEFPEDIREAEVHEGLVRYTFHISETRISLDPKHKSFSRLLGKKLIPPVSKEKSGFWPYTEKKEKFEDFIIGANEEGEPIMYTSDPDRLANYFGANPDAPHYLTPVYFRREVLAKYYANPEKYSIEDGYLRCAGLWGLRLDNNHSQYVIAFLGDLGRDLHHEEQMYWRSFNVLPEGEISTVNFRRSFLGQFANPEKIDLVFKYRFEGFRERWFEKKGWHLFSPLSKDDQHLYIALHVPLTNDQAEFDGQVLALTKLIIDSLNEEQLKAATSSSEPELKGITKFERFLAEQSFPDYQAHIKFLRNLQSLRSTGVGHRKGRNYEKVAQEFGLGKKDRALIFEEMLKRGTDLLEALADHFLR